VAKILLDQICFLGLQDDHAVVNSMSEDPVSAFRDGDSFLLIGRVYIKRPTIDNPRIDSFRSLRTDFNSASLYR
jgi:hypothetical protein